MNTTTQENAMNDTTQAMQAAEANIETAQNLSSQLVAGKRDIYDTINARILELIDAGVDPWRKTWSLSAQFAPMNLISGKKYRGINHIMLAMANYESPYWLTFNQARAKGGSVKKGEKASLAVFWKLYDIKETQESQASAENDKRFEMKKIPILKQYYVFNVEQCQGIKAPELAKAETFTHDPIAEAEAIVKNMPSLPTITHKQTRQPCYVPKTDTVELPPRERFHTAEEYYATLFHELAHATGHESRLNRDMTGKFGDQKYGREELTAEMAAAYLCGLCNIHNKTEKNQAAYLDAWRGLIKADKRAIVVAAGAAQRAVDFMTNTATENNTNNEEE